MVHIILGRTTLTLHDETMQKLVKVRGKLENNNGKRRDLEDVINDLIAFFEREVEK